MLNVTMTAIIRHFYRYETYLLSDDLNAHGLRLTDVEWVVNCSELRALCDQNKQ